MESATAGSASKPVVVDAGLPMASAWLQGAVPAQGSPVPAALQLQVWEVRPVQLAFARTPG